MAVFQDGKQIGEIKSYSFSAPGELTQTPSGYFIANSTQQATPNTNSQITSGTIEGSNVDINQEQVAMILGSTGYKANLKGITLVDELTETILDIKG